MSVSLNSTELGCCDQGGETSERAVGWNQILGGRVRNDHLAMR